MKRIMKRTMKKNINIKNTQKYKNLFLMKRQVNNSHKKTNKKQKKECVYIFGYGSLMNDLSRFKTHVHTKKTYDAVLLPEFGYVRSWNTMIPNNQIVLGIQKNKNKNTPINGVLFKICKCCLDKFIERETHYNVRTIPSKYVKFTSEKSFDLNTNKIITFVTKPQYNANKKLNKKTAKNYFIPKRYYSIIKKTQSKSKSKSQKNKNKLFNNYTFNLLDLKVR